METVLVVTFTLALATLYLTHGSVYDQRWYRTLRMSALTPPPVVFGIVWPILYVLIASAGILLFLAPQGKWRSRALLAYNVQLLLNFLWSWLFFKQHLVRFALLDNALMIVLTVFTMASARKCAPLAAKLLLPYILWISFAAYLGSVIVYQN